MAGWVGRKQQSDLRSRQHWCALFPLCSMDLSLCWPRGEACMCEQLTVITWLLNHQFSTFSALKHPTPPYSYVLDLLFINRLPLTYSVLTIPEGNFLLVLIPLLPHAHLSLEVFSLLLLCPPSPQIIQAPFPSPVTTSASHGPILSLYPSAPATEGPSHWNPSASYFLILYSFLSV